MYVHKFDAKVHLNHLNAEATYEALNQTEKNLEVVLEKMDENTTLIISSDHGMVEKGHGGYTDEERLATFFAYSKKGFIDIKELGLEEEPFFRSIDVSSILNYYIGSTFNLNSLGHFQPEVLEAGDYSKE